VTRSTRPPRGDSAGGLTVRLTPSRDASQRNSPGGAERGLPEPIWKLPYGRYSPCRAPLEGLQRLFANSRNGFEAWSRLFDAVSAWRHMRQMYRRPNLSRERATLKALSKRIRTLADGFADLEPYTASVLGHHYGNATGVRSKRVHDALLDLRQAPELEGVLQGLEDLCAATQAALDHSLARGDGTTADVGAHTLALRIWEILREGNISSNTDDGSPFAQCLDVALPLIGAKVSTRTILSTFVKKAMTVKPRASAPAIPSLAELAIPRGATPAKKARVHRKHRP
jgi:hypothetical protein